MDSRVAASSASGTVFPAIVCLLVNRVTQKLRVDFHKILGIGRLLAMEELVRFLEGWCSVLWTICSQLIW